MGEVGGGDAGVGEGFDAGGVGDVAGVRGGDVGEVGDVTAVPGLVGAGGRGGCCVRRGLGFVGGCGALEEEGEARF